jgi:hemerythrin superfamily protein
VKEKSRTRAKASTNRRASGTKRAASSASGRAQDAIALLKSDHREVDELMQRYEKARSDRKEAIARQICLALRVHAQIEEELLYPAARESLDADDGDLVDEAAVEHATIKRLVGEVEGSSPGDSLYDAKVTVIGEYVKHHVKEEEKELFPKLRDSELDLDALGEQLAARKAVLMQERQRAG